MINKIRKYIISKENVPLHCCLVHSHFLFLFSERNLVTALLGFNECIKVRFNVRGGDSKYSWQMFINERSVLEFIELHQWKCLFTYVDGAEENRHLLSMPPHVWEVLLKRTVELQQRSCLKRLCQCWIRLQVNEFKLQSCWVHSPHCRLRERKPCAFYSRFFGNLKIALQNHHAVLLTWMSTCGGY